jgi:hypothetical protein
MIIIYNNSNSQEISTWEHPYYFKEDAVAFSFNNLPNNLRDSICKYFELDDCSKKDSLSNFLSVFLYENKMFTSLELRSKYSKKDDTYRCLFSIDLTNNSFVLYRNTIRHYSSHETLFIYHKNLYYILKENIDIDTSYLRIILLNKDSVEKCKQFVVKDQARTGLKYKELKSKFKPIIYEENGFLKIGICSFKTKITKNWNILQFLPRGRGNKWRSYNTKNYIYSFDDSLNFISRENVEPEPQPDWLKEILEDDY